MTSLLSNLSKVERLVPKEPTLREDAHLADEDGAPEERHLGQLGHGTLRVFLRREFEDPAQKLTRGVTAAAGKTRPPDEMPLSSMTEHDVQGAKLRGDFRLATARQTDAEREKDDKQGTLPGTRFIDSAASKCSLPGQRCMFEPTSSISHHMPSHQLFQYLVRDYCHLAANCATMRAHGAR
ncbi:hypothetical protein DFH09DRAFT_1082887 [Mycena vulgaris]|nr:hypothetical protein DFH09DRAFT_1082887 [Mycena vulgaris]